MKTKALPTRQLCRLALFAALLAPAGNALAAPVTEQEALEIAEFWYPAEINHYDEQGWDRGPERKSDLLAAVQIISVRYLVGKDTIVDKLKRKHQVLAYIIEFAPRGHLVLAADDSITPLLAFNIDSQFSWDNPEGGNRPTFMRLFLNGYVSDAWAYLRDLAASGAADQIHSSWSDLRAMAFAQKDLEPVYKTYHEMESLSPWDIGMIMASGTPDPSSAEVILPTATWGQGDNYNDALNVWVIPGVTPPADWNNGNGVLTGCHATALAIKLRYHEWPITPNDTQNGSDIDPWDDATSDRPGERVFGSGSIPVSTVYQWSNMPTSDINNPSNPNADIAQLMFHTGIISRSDWETDLSGGTAGRDDTGYLNYHFRYLNSRIVWAQCATSPALPEANCQYHCEWTWEYFFCPNNKTWNNANAACASQGAELARIENVEENDYIADEVSSLGWSRAWMGASDSATEDVWVWPDGDQFWAGGPGGNPVGNRYSNWKAGEPNDYGSGEDCGEIRSDSFWNDRSCGSTQAYVCKRPIDSSTILPDIRASVVRGLPVMAYADWAAGGHVVVIDGYRDNVPPSGPADSYVRVNDGGGGASEWHAVYRMRGYPCVLEGGVVYMAPRVYVYVDPSHSGPEYGTPEYPVNSINEGISIIQTRNSEFPGLNRSRLWLRAGYYASDSARVFEDPMEISSFEGDTSITSKFLLSSSGEVKIGSGGSMTINP